VNMLASDHRTKILATLHPGAKEKNWFLYAITDRGPKKKPGKYPAKPGKPWRAIATKDAAVWTLAEAMEARDLYNSNPGKIERHNAEARRIAEAQKKKPGPPIIRYEVGYYPREGSAFVLWDIDDCRDPATGMITRPEIAEILDPYDGYREPSTSGTGLRLVMPREEGDEALSGAAEHNGLGFLASSTGKGMALTLQPERLRIAERGWDMVFERLIELRGALKPKGPKGEIEPTDAALEFAHVTLDDLRDMLAHIPNDERFDERGQWVGFVKSIAEVFVPRGLGDEAFEIVDEWTENRDGNWDPEANRAVWDEPPGGGMSFASVIYHARQGGWKRAPVLGEFAIVDGDYYDLAKHKNRNADQMWRLTKSWDMTDLKGKPVAPNKEPRLGWLNDNLAHYAGTVFDPRAGATVENPKYKPAGTYLNTFRPLRSIPYEGRVPQPWLDHLAVLVPDAGDREWVLEWLAFVVQNPGRKVNWSPVFIGPEGCGKDTLFGPLEEWFGSYLHPKVTLRDATHNFNAWLHECLVALVQEKQGGRWHDKTTRRRHSRT
jgi:hypothetical protein